MKTEKVTEVYKCENCGERFLDKDECLRHEQKCIRYFDKNSQPKWYDLGPVKNSQPKWYDLGYPLHTRNDDTYLEIDRSY